LNAAREKNWFTGAVLTHDRGKPTVTVVFEEEMKKFFAKFC